jgi:hypothetical protein
MLKDGLFGNDTVYVINININIGESILRCGPSGIMRRKIGAI